LIEGIQPVNTIDNEMADLELVYKEAIKSSKTVEELHLQV
jgi:hypothetical protein